MNPGAIAAALLGISCLVGYLYYGTDLIKRRRARLAAQAAAQSQPRCHQCLQPKHAGTCRAARWR